MRIHTDLHRADIEAAARRARVGIIRLNEHGSRSAPRAFEVILSGSGNYGGQYGTLDGKSGTWDEWGIALAEIYRRDPSAKCGPYLNADHFRWSTGGRYDELAVANQHLRHKWEWSGDSVTGVYFVRECRCGAIRRWLHNARSWAEIAPPPEPTTAERLAALRAEITELHATAEIIYDRSIYESDGLYEREYRLSLADA